MLAAFVGAWAVAAGLGLGVATALGYGPIGVLVFIVAGLAMSAAVVDHYVGA